MIYAIEAVLLTYRLAGVTVERVVVNDVQGLAATVTAEIRMQCALRDMSYRELSRRLGKSHTWVQARFSGRQAYDLDDLEAIAQALDTTVQELLGVGAFGTGVYVPPDVQKVIDRLAGEIMSKLEPPAIVTAAERRALLRTVNEAIGRYVVKGIDYWEQARTNREPAMRKRSGRG